MYITLSILAIIIGILLITIANNKDICPIYVIGIVFLVYGIVCLLILPAQTEAEDAAFYEKAKAEAFVLQNSDKISIELANTYLSDIKRTNEMIANSKKYYDHWYLSAIYHKKIAFLEPIQLEKPITLKTE